MLKDGSVMRTCSFYLVVFSGVESTTSRHSWPISLQILMAHVRLSMTEGSFRYAGKLTLKALTVLTWTGSLANVAIGVEVVSLNSTHHGYISTDQDSHPCSNTLGYCAKDDRPNLISHSTLSSETNNFQSTSPHRTQDPRRANVAGQLTGPGCASWARVCELAQWKNGGI